MGIVKATGKRTLTRKVPNQEAGKRAKTDKSKQPTDKTGTQDKKKRAKKKGPKGGAT